MSSISTNRLFNSLYRGVATSAASSRTIQQGKKHQHPSPTARCRMRTSREERVYVSIMELSIVIAACRAAFHFCTFNFIIYRQREKRFSNLSAKRGLRQLHNSTELILQSCFVRSVCRQRCKKPDRIHITVKLSSFRESLGRKLSPARVLTTVSSIRSVR